MQNELTATSSASFLLGGGEMGGLMRSHDWSQTSLGSPEQWSQSLKTTVRIVLTSRQPMFVWWGNELLNLYNDAYAAFLHTKHPAALGQPAFEVWREIWDQLEPRVESVIYKNEGTFDEAQFFIMERKGYREETYVTFSYSPIPDDAGIGGLLCACTDDTQRIVGERQLALLQELAAKTADARTFDEACTLSAGCLKTNPYDLPFALIYLVDSDHQQATLAGTSGIQPGHPLVPETVTLEQASIWGLGEVLRSQQPILVPLSTETDLPRGAWQQAPDQAVAVPIASSGQAGKSGILVVGLNPFRLFDDTYQGFLNLVSGQIAASIANAQAYEEERKRAEALAEIDRAKTVFFSNVSHEFRTPLTLMLSPLEELSNSLDERLQPDEREQLQLVQRNGLRLQKLVNTLLDFSRIEAGRVQATYEPTDLAAFTAELASVFRSAIERAEMRLVVGCPPLPEAVYVDREMWEKIVLNLLSNAFKFTFVGEISVSLKWQSDRVELAVRDTGIGIPADELPRLFERFHRVKGAQGRSFEGSGIGLSLVQELVKLHQGAIAVTSVEGEGTCFTVSIPTGKAHLPQDRIGAPRTLASTALGTNAYLEEALRWLPGENRRADEWMSESIDNSPATHSSIHPSTPSPKILLADDNADMRDYVRRLLSQQYEVEAVSDGLAALSAIDQQIPDLILTDVMMPNLDGFGLLQAIRSNPETREIPVILLSARAGEEARVEGLAAGADDYLIKPFSARELLARVESTLKLAQIRKQAETTVREREERLELAMEAGRMIAWEWNPFDDSLILSANFSEIYGATDIHTVEQGITLLHPADRSQHRAIIEQAVETRSEYRCEFRVIRPDTGAIVWLEERGQPILNEDGTLQKLIGVSIDVSERKQAEVLIQAKNDRLKLLSEMTNELLLNENPQSFLNTLFQKLSTHLNLEIYVNYLLQEDEQRLRLIAYSGISTEIASAAEFLELGQAVCGYVVQHQAAAVIENALESSSFLAAPLHPIGIRSYASYPLMVDNQAIGTLGFGTRNRDRFLPEELELMQTVCDQVSTALQRSKLIKALQQRAEELAQANRIKDEFLAVLSHELRSPLNPILGWSTLLLNGKLDTAKTTQALTIIQRNAKLQSELIEDLLDVSRILQGKLNLNVAPVNLAISIQGAMETVRLAAEAKSIQVKSSLAEDVGLVLGDATRLQQIVWNLLSNAVKFTPPGGQITIRLERLDSFAQITVSDTGQGIAPDFLPYVFDYFRQADAATTRKFGGLGLGLAIVRHFVELHGGTVSAASPGEGQGATFTVRFPLMPTPSQVNQDGRSPQQSPDLNGIKILIVDDEPDTRDLVAFVLEQQGAQVITATSAHEALLALPQAKPDVLLSDIGMPEMDGYMLIQQVRALAPEQGGQIPAIALTAYAGDTDQRRVIAAGFQKHISKPIEPEVLVQTIVHLIYPN